MKDDAFNSVIAEVEVKQLERMAALPCRAKCPDCEVFAAQLHMARTDRDRNADLAKTWELAAIEANRSAHRWRNWFYFAALVAAIFILASLH